MAVSGFFGRSPDDEDTSAAIADLDLAEVFADADGDGLPDRTEAFLGTNPHLADTDGDGMPDSEDPVPALAPDSSDGAQVRAAAVAHVLAFPNSPYFVEGILGVVGDCHPMGNIAVRRSVILFEPRLPIIGRVQLGAVTIADGEASVVAKVLQGLVGWSLHEKLTLRLVGGSWRVVDSVSLR